MTDLAIEDVINQAADDERKHEPSSFSLRPFYFFLSNAMHIARGQERQALINDLPKREEGHSKDWNDGYDAAIKALIRILVERSYTH